MKIFFTILFSFFFGYLFPQNDIVVIQRDCFDNSCLKKQKQMHTFNRNGDVTKFIIYGDYHNPDTIYLGYISKFKYKGTKLIDKKSYKGKYLESDIRFSYKKDQLDSIIYDNKESLKYFYDKNKNIKSTVMKNGSDTLRVMTYTYNDLNELSMIFRYSNNIQNEKIIYLKSGDTIIETSLQNDSIYIDKPLKTVYKKVFKDEKLIYSSSVYGFDSIISKKHITYDFQKEVIKIENIDIEKDKSDKEKSDFIYTNGIISRIEKFVFTNDIWKSKYFIVYQIKKANRTLSKKIKNKINKYLIGRFENILE